MATAATCHRAYTTAETIDFRPSIVAFLFKSLTGWLVLLVSPFLMGIPLLLVAVAALRYRMTHFELSGDRLFIRQGILFRSEEEIELYRVKDVRADFSIIQQLFGVGNLRIISSDATGRTVCRQSTFRIANVENARRLREELRDRIERARQARGVREFDTY